MTKINIDQSKWEKKHITTYHTKKNIWWLIFFHCDFFLLLMILTYKMSKYMVEPIWFDNKPKRATINVKHTQKVYLSWLKVFCTAHLSCQGTFLYFVRVPDKTNLSSYNWSFESSSSIHQLTYTVLYYDLAFGLHLII